MPLRSYADGAMFGDERTPGQLEVIGLHGWQRDRSDLLPALGDRAAVLLDLPGFGSSPPPPVAWGAHDYAALVARVIEGSDGPPPVLVGHSFGGRVAVCLAADRPELVSGLVLCGVPLLRVGSPPKPPLGYRALRTLNRWKLVSDDRMEERRRRSGSADYRAATGILREVLVRAVNETYAEELQQLTCPVALLWGEQDAQVPAAVATLAAEQIANVVEVVVIPDASHDVHRERPDEVGRLVDAVAARVRPS